MQIIVFYRVAAKSYSYLLIQVLFTIAVLGLIGYSAASTFSSSSSSSTPSSALILTSLLIFGGFGLAACPLILELVVETQYPAPEATGTVVVVVFVVVVVVLSS